ncbi:MULTISPECIES: histidine--tRNA ligase [unclassified Sphingobium]|uniref:histidine--tRNA ligase n=1 Tax=unclassified Sphingobium TaxID=2611147 RepID=UPI00119A679A|nr:MULTISPECIES: histidine--tRNA ligase [unclassified Sphingobium]MBG6118083.1 histidyl-tRNA synthetase [Sphingobium sp. JAI105]TWC99933.1 histidyl-tRNA synthetase [Sphingobium sp. AEW010]TWD19100.1 histidyl-tRNA synthetase [Sphingobium sp. AEW013]TWD21999.1 histidyl-tRNA synthetase [Sphingobium sp. AEW001]
MAKIETPRPVRGTQDMLGGTAEAFAERFAHVVATFDRVRKLYGFQRVEVPVFESTAVFARSLGESTDVVSKEMYTFEDRGGDSITLRPEFTAGISRAYITEGWQQYAPLKVATHGPLFRYERPQKGRFRQFHQLDAEIIGAAEPGADVELLVFADQLLKELGIDEGVTLTLNTLGDAASREAWRAALIAHFEAHRGDLSEDSVDRLAKNPLRILDSKDPRDRPVADSAPDIDAYLTDEARSFFEKVTSGLDAAGVAWERNARLVRGLDYYRHTAFEFVTDRLGAQGTVLGGGRYDGLIENLGGPATPAVGWAAGIERLAMLVDAPERERPEIAVIPDNPELQLASIAIAGRLRAAGIATELAVRGNAKKQTERAVKAGIEALLFVRAPDASGGEYYLRYNGADIGGLRAISDRVQLALKLEQLMSGTGAR